jgi:regulator of sigma E protease
MKQILFLLLLIGLIVAGHFRIPAFDSYLWMMGLISILVIAHEFGHFTVAKKVGVKVERFGFGLPLGPTLFEKQIGETKFCLHPVLLGGYVSFPDDDPDSDIPKDSPRRFENRTMLERTAIAIAGVVVNFILGYLIMVFVIAKWGYPADYFVKLDHFHTANSPAAQAGLLPGDLFVKMGDQKVQGTASLIDYFAAHKQQPIPVTVNRNGAQKIVTVIPNRDGKIEIALSFSHQHIPVKNPAEVLTKAYTFLAEKISMNFRAMGEILTGQRSSKEISGPVGIIKQGGMMIQLFGISEGLVITALISVILAIMNILPIPMLDGGHLLFMFLEKLQGHPLKKEIQERIVQVSFAVLMGLMCLILWNDLNTYIFHH